MSNDDSVEEKMNFEEQEGLDEYMVRFKTPLDLFTPMFLKSILCYLSMQTKLTREF